MQRERPFHLDPTWSEQDMRLSSLESLLMALHQRDLTTEQLDRLALIIEWERRHCLAQARREWSVEQ